MKFLRRQPLLPIAASVYLILVLGVTFFLSISPASRVPQEKQAIVAASAPRK